MMEGRSSKGGALRHAPAPRISRRLLPVLAWLPVFLALLAPYGFGAENGAEPSLDRASVPARGRQKALLTVGAFGRYAVLVKSPKGMSLQLADRMAGPVEIAGKPGAEDGRVDLFLDRGQYQVLARGPRKESGKARLEVHAFREKSGPMPPMLLEFRPIGDSLDDLEQRSYWLEVKERRRVALEAAGRNLADLRLWKDGSWLVDAEPEKGVLEPKTGQPLQVCRLAPELEPGLYLVTAYGGKGQPWAEGSVERPFYLRFGIPALGTAGRRRFTASPLGVDRWLVPGDATYFRLELPEARPASLSVVVYSTEHPFPEGSGEAIGKNSVLPVAEANVSALDKEWYHLVTVRTEPGRAYVLQHFELTSEYHFRAEGEHWISTVHSGQPGDSVDATGILTRTDRAGKTDRSPYRAEVVQLDRERGWARRANLLDPLTVFLYVAQAGKYEILSRRTEAKYRIEPFFTQRPEQYKPPEFAGGGSVWELDAGYHVLTAVPVKEGILEIGVRPIGLRDFTLDRLGAARKPGAEPVTGAIYFPSVSLIRDDQYVLYLNHQPEVKAGVVVRPLPIDISEPFPLTRKPGETVTVPIHAGERGTARAECEDGSPLDLSIDGKP